MPFALSFNSEKGCRWLWHCCLKGQIETIRYWSSRQYFIKHRSQGNKGRQLSSPICIHQGCIFGPLPVAEDLLLFDLGKTNWRFFWGHCCCIPTYPLSTA